MRWTYYATLFLGLWLIASPATFGYAADPISRNNDIVCGILSIAFGIYSLTRLKIWAAWIIFAIGAWLQFSPLLFWAKEPAIYLNDTLIGVLLISVAILIPRLPREHDDKDSDIPLGWSYNPSNWSQRIPVILLGTICWFLARYLAGFELGYYPNVWDPIFDNGTRDVLTSTVSHDFPVPDAGLGAMAYTLEALLGCKGSEKRWRTMPWIVFTFGLLVVPVGIISIILVILQPVIVGAWCTLCLLTALSMIIMVILTLDEVTASIQYLHWSYQKGHPFWKTFWKGGTIPNMPSPKLTTSQDCGFLGVSWSWTLIVSALIGILLMFSAKHFGLTGSMADSTHIVGALTTVFSLISLAEVARIGRYLNILLGAWLILSTFILQALALGHMITLILAGIVLILLAFRRGRVEECYGTYQKFIL